MRGRLLMFLLAALAATACPSAVVSAPFPDLTAMVAGIVSSGSVVAGGVPLSTGGWGTDYITVSHALEVRGQYAIIRSGLPYAEARAVTSCSSQYHGIDVLVLRAAAHPRTPVVNWGDPAELKAGDELLMFPRREFHPDPVSVKFVHLNLLEWTKASPTVFSREWRNVMVGDGFGKPGFSGSPWSRDGKVYGLLKGRLLPPGHTRWVIVAETATRIRECLQRLSYDDLIPQE